MNYATILHILWLIIALHFRPSKNQYRLECVSERKRERERREKPGGRAGEAGREGRGGTGTSRFCQKLTSRAAVVVVVVVNLNSGSCMRVH